MPEKIEKQLFQVQNIIETLQEATGHLSDLVKKKELNQCIFIFSSIVDGSNAVIQILSAIDKVNYQSHLRAIEKYLLLIAQQLEQGNFMKIAIILQFSFAPELKKLQNTFIDRQGNQKKEKTISIGFFHSWANPKDFYPAERLNATVLEGKKQNSNLYFFTSDDVNFKDQQVDAYTFKNDSWHRIKVAFPDVIHNVGVGKQSRIERKLRRIVPFTSFHVGNKFSLPLRMLENRDYAELLVPFRLCMGKEGIYSFLEGNDRVVFKALKSNRGENIYFLTRKGNRYVLLDQKKETILSQTALKHFIENIILGEKGSYIVQKYIHTRTKNDEPYHFRAHVQKNGEGNWQLTHIYPRIGNKKSNLSNISTEGRVENFYDFLIDEFGKREGARYEEEILDLSIKIATHLDKLYGLVLDELGLDFAIDDTGRIWMHEANNGPQTAFHEEKRAVNTIAYAKYIAENGIVNNKVISAGLPKDQFKAKTSTLPSMKTEKYSVTAALIEDLPSKSLLKVLVEKANEQDMKFYYFTPKDIDFDEMLIRGNYYGEGQWNERIFEYPDVIIDFIKSNKSLARQIMYEELEHIPFTNRLPEPMKKRTEIFKEIAEKDFAIEYEKIGRTSDVFKALELFKKIIVKQDDILSNETYLIAKVDKKYQVINQNKIKYYNELQLRHFLQTLIEKNGYIVQKDMREKFSENQTVIFDIHVMKNEKNEWTVINKNANIQTGINENEVEINIKSFSDFVEKKYDKESIEDLSNQLIEFSITAVSSLEKEVSTHFSEATLQLTINDKQELNILEIIPVILPSMIDEKKYAKASILYANHLIESQK